MSDVVVRTDPAGPAPADTSSIRPARRVDEVSVLSAYLLVLFVLPGRFVVSSLGAAGTPAVIIGLGCAWTWCLHRLSSRSPAGRQPVRVVVLVFGWAMIAGFTAAQLRPLSDVEASAAPRTALFTLAWVGVALVAVDGIRTLERLDTLLRRLVFAGAAMGAFGVVQYVTGFDPFSTLSIPGLTVDTPLESIASRSDLRRVSATALHAIEYGVVLAMIFPIALHYALVDRRRRPHFARAQLACISIGLPVSISRSAVLGMVVGLAFLAVTWDRRRIVNVAAVGALFLVVFRALVPGVLGTISSLFLKVGVDPSVSGRTEDYGQVGRFLGQSPLFGRGIGTFVPEQYFYLDNEYLGLAIQAGIVGLLAFVALLVVAISCARGGRRRAQDPVDRDLGQAIAASVAVAAVTFATFDGLTFRISSGLLFLLVGCAGAYWRLHGGVDDAR